METAGTSFDIVRGLGIVLIFLASGFILIVALRAFKNPKKASTKWGLLMAFGILPLSLLLVSDSILLGEMKEVTFCGSCHPMEPFVKSVKDPADSTLADVHVKRHFIREEQCYTCHTDYALMGGLKAKTRGLRHLYAYYTKDLNQRPQLYSPYPNGNCLHCQTGEEKYEQSPTHQTILDELKKGETPCLDCHGPAHPGRGGEVSE
ncbi:MAG: NapC/NirT family cytochrome c [Limisphaerales bacterium]